MLLKHESTVNLVQYYPEIPSNCDIFADMSGRIHYYYKFSEDNDDYADIGESPTRAWCQMCEMSEEETVIWILKFGKQLPSHISHLDSFSCLLKMYNN